MNSNSAEKLQALLNEDIARFDKESEKHKRIHRRVQTGIITLTAVTAVVAGAGLVVPDADNAIQFAILCLATVTTAVTSWAEMRRARELWRHEREVYYALIDIRREVQFYEAVGGLDPEKVEAYFHKANAILGSSTQKWSKILERKQQVPDNG